ncbi:MAG: GGDEF domain-containing protein [Bacillota bacterium]|nr:GGDEF domain-containing protein [Bacillota bacterium]
MKISITLTGAWTRESFYSYISQRIQQRNVEKFGAVYLDLDGLKIINDEYGHLEGDFAIKTTVQLIKCLLRKTDIVARVGGDEFVIITACESKEDLYKMIGRIEAGLIQYNSESGKGYKLECSYGADIYSDNYNDVEQFMYHVDQLMYSNKKEKTLDQNLC